LRYCPATQRVDQADADALGQAILAAVAPHLKAGDAKAVVE
jgi:hypothetical protein